MKKTYLLSDKLFDDISALCDKLNVDWFYNKYRERKTIDVEDISDLYKAWKEGVYDKNSGTVYTFPLTEALAEMFRKTIFQS